MKKLEKKLKDFLEEDEYNANTYQNHFSKEPFSFDLRATESRRNGEN